MEGQPTVRPETTQMIIHRSECGEWRWPYLISWCVFCFGISWNVNRRASSAGRYLAWNEEWGVRAGQLKKSRLKITCRPNSKARLLNKRWKFLSTAAHIPRACPHTLPPPPPQAHSASSTCTKGEPLGKENTHVIQQARHSCITQGTKGQASGRQQAFLAARAWRGGEEKQ